MSKHEQTKKKPWKKFIIILLLLILFFNSILFIKIKISNNAENKSQEDVSKLLDTIKISKNNITNTTTERMLQIQELQKINSDIIGWIEINGTNINYPVLQGDNNDYYLTHNYKNEYTSTGSIFLDKSYDFDKPSSNLLIYGHRNKKGLMFDELIKYKDENFYKEHQTIRFTTTNEDSEYEILAAFKSRVYYTDETNVFRYYYFIDAEDENEYNDYIKNAKNASLYETGITATYGDKLMTLSTCDYEVDNGRFAIVAKEIK